MNKKIILICLSVFWCITPICLFGTYEQSPKSPNSPRSPRSPKTPRLSKRKIKRGLRKCSSDPQKMETLFEAYVRSREGKENYVCFFCQIEERKAQQKKLIQEKWEEAEKLRSDYDCDYDYNDDNSKVIQAMKILQKHVVYQTIDPELSAKARLLSAIYYATDAEVKRYDIAEKHIWTIMHVLGKKAKLSDCLYSQAHARIAKIYQAKADLNNNKRNKYKKISIKHYRKAIKKIEKIKTNHEEETAHFEKIIFECKTQVAMYYFNQINNFFDGQDPKKCSDSALKKILKKIEITKNYFQDIIDFQPTQLSASILYNQICFMINLGTLYSNSIDQEYQKGITLYNLALKSIAANKKIIDELIGESKTQYMIKKTSQNIKTNRKLLNILE